MIKTYLSLVCLLVVLMNAKSVSAQLSIKLAGKKYRIPEFNNTNAIPASYMLHLDSENYKYHIIEPLSSSANQFEVRCSYTRYLINPYVVDMLKADKDSLWWEEYTIYWGHERKPGATKYIEVNQHHIISVFFKRGSIAHSSYSIVDSLIHLSLFTQPDISTIDSDLRQKNVKLQRVSMLDGPPYMLFNIKVNQSYRSFWYNSYHFIGNPDVKELADANNLVKTFLRITSGHEDDL
jgi:hypothetical protein